MPILVKDHWKKLNGTVWRLLEKRQSAPPDMYIELLRLARRRLNIQVDEAIDAALSDPKVAKAEFLALPQPQNESKCIELLEAYYNILRDFVTPTIAADYLFLLRKFVEDRNLRYTLSNDCRFQLSIQGLLMSQYARFRKAVVGTTEVEESLDQLEDSVSRLRQGRYEHRNCIGITSNMIEGVVCRKTTNGQRTLGRAITGCGMFAHQNLMKCVTEFYNFASDFSNIRHGHAVNPNQLRPLKKEDAILAVALAVGLGSYIFDTDSSREVLDGDL
jgi:hypothetical protein